MLRRLTLIPQGFTIVIAAFLPIFAIVSMFPAVPSIIDHFAADPKARWMVPMAVSAPGLTIALVAPFAGWLVDRIGRRRLLLAATFLYGLVGAAPFFVESLGFLIASRLLLGFAEAAILTIVNTLIGDYWDDTGRRDWLFIQGVAGPFLASGVILAAGPATAIRWNGIFLIYLVAFPVWAAMLAWVFEPKQATPIASAAERRVEPGTPFPLGQIALVGAVTLLGSALYYVFIINGGLAFREVGIQSATQLSELTFIPTLFIILGAAIFRLLGGRSNAVQLGVFFLFLGGGLLGIGLAPDYRWMLAALVVQQTGAGMTVPSLIAWTQTKLPFEHRGRGMGIWTSCFFFGQFSSPALVHVAQGVTGSFQGAFTIAGVLGFACAGVALLRRSDAPPPVALEA